MTAPAEIFELRGLADTLLIGPRAAFGRGAQWATQSEDDVRRRLLHVLADEATIERLRRFAERWRLGGEGPTRLADPALIERVALAVRRGQLAACVIPNMSLQTVKRPNVAGTQAILEKLRQPTQAPAGRAARRIGAPPPVYRPVGAGGGGGGGAGEAGGGPASDRAGGAAGPAGAASEPGVLVAQATVVNVGTMPLEQRFEQVLRRTLPLLPSDMQEEFKKLLDPAVIAQTVALLVVWAASHACGVGEVLDAIMAILAIYALGWAAWDAAWNMVEFLRLTLYAETDADLDKAAAMLARVIAAIGVKAFVQLLTRGAARVSSKGKPGGAGKFDKKPEPEPQPKAQPIKKPKSTPPVNPQKIAAKNRLAKHRNDVKAHQKRYEDRLARAKKEGASKQTQAGIKAQITEAKGELAAADYMSKKHPDLEMARGFQKGTGFDQVYVKRDAQGKIVEYTVVEAKGPGAKLATGAKKGDQMSAEWTRNTAQEMAQSANPETKKLGQDLLKALDSGEPPVRGKVLQADDAGGAHELPCPDDGIFN